MAAARGLEVLEARVVGFAYFSRDVEPEARSAGRRGEERLEELTAQRRRDTRPIVDHIQFYSSLLLIHVDHDTNAAFFATTVPGCIAAEIPHHLVEMTAVE